MTSQRDEPPDLRCSLSSKELGSASAGWRYLTYFLLIPLIAAATAFFGCISLVCSVWDRAGTQQHKVARVWAKVILRISLSPVHLIGADVFHHQLVAVYASNHLSYMDTPLLFSMLPFPFRILAKQSLWKIPFIGWHLRRSGQVPVDQSSSRSAVLSISRGVAALRAGLPLVLFPEGGRSATGETQSFLPGCAYMAIKAQVPIVPLTLVGTYELLPMHVYHLRPRPLCVIVGEPISTVGMTPREAASLVVRVRTIISETYISHYEAARSRTMPRREAGDA